jgi:replication factor C large subunit
MAANDPDLNKIRPLKKVCKLIRFHQIRVPLIIILLKKICSLENISAEFEALEKIAINSQGDVRSAINDLQSLARIDKIIRVEDTKILTNRTKDVNLFETLKGVFSAKSPQKAIKIINYSSVNFDDFLLSISDNMPLRYLDFKDLSIAYDLLSKADMVRGRIGIENWNLLKYFFNFLAQSTTLSPETYEPFEFIYPPMRIIKLFWSKSHRQKIDKISLKIAKALHVSKRTAINDILPFIKIIIEKDKVNPAVSSLNFDQDEINFIIKMKKL